MNSKNFLLYRLLSGVSLLFTIALTIVAYFRMDKLMPENVSSQNSIEFQIFVWGIIISATLSFFISWRLFLVIDSINADVEDDVDKTNLDEFSKSKNENKYAIDWDKFFSKHPIENKDTINYESVIQGISRALDLDVALVFEINKTNRFESKYTYAYLSEKAPPSFALSEGIHGQVAQNKKPLHLHDIPENYVKIASGSGYILPKNVYILPLVINDKTVSVYEFADMKLSPSNTFESLQQFIDGINQRIL